MLLFFSTSEKAAIINFTKQIGTGTVPKEKYRVASQWYEYRWQIELVYNRKLRIYMSHTDSVKERVNRNQESVKCIANQCRGSMKYWYGSGSADPCL
jgi:hypothetical protein